MRGLRLPKRSANAPKMSAPIGRIARVAVMVHTMADFSTLNLAARLSTRNMTTKKSKASRIQPRMPEAAAYFQRAASEAGRGCGLSISAAFSQTLALKGKPWERPRARPVSLCSGPAARRDLPDQLQSQLDLARRCCRRAEHSRISQCRTIRIEDRVVVAV